MSYTLTAADASITSIQKQLDSEPLTNDGVNYTGDQITVLGTFSPSDESVIDGFIPMSQLAFAKEEKLSDIRMKTLKLINDGFTHLSMSFPLVLDSRSNYIGIQVFYAIPANIQNADQTDVLTISNQTDYDSFSTAGLLRYKYIKDEESLLIIEIRDAATISTVNAIVDSRA